MSGEVVELPVNEIGPGPLVREQRIDLDHRNLLVPVLDDVPPILVRETAKGWSLVDGQHRLAAAKEAGRPTIRATVVALDDAEALEAAIEANTTHGKPLSLVERKAAARTLVESTKFSDRRIASICSIDERTVAAMRPADRPTAGNGAVGRSEGSDGKQRPASPEAAKAQREAIARMLDEHPDLSANEIARRLGCSAMTVLAVRKEREAPSEGAAATPPAASATPTEQPGDACVTPSPALGLAPPIPDDAPTTAGELLDPCPVPGEWRKHPAMKRTNATRDAALILDRRMPRDSEPVAAVAAGIPPELAPGLIREAHHAARFWTELADALTRPVTLSEVR